MCLPNRASLAAHVAVSVLASGIVVDKSKSDKLSAAEQAALFGQVYGTGLGLPVVFVDNARTFFTSKNLFQALEANDHNWRLIAEHFKIDVSPAELNTITGAINIRKRIIAAVQAIKLPYTLASVPEGWSIESDLNLAGNKVQRRRTNRQGNGNGYCLNVKTLERIWIGASNHWANPEGAQCSLPPIKHNYDERAVRVTAGVVDVGCQAIQRYELEQLALHLDWPFPETTV